MRQLLLTIATALGAAALLPGGAAAAFDFGFKTTDGAAYCQLEVKDASANSFICFTPNDGWWIRFNRINSNSPTVSKGYSSRYKRFHPTGARLLAFGKDWYSSDAGAVVCRSRSNGLTCKTYSGLSFWIGRYRGYRIFYDTPGEHPNVKALFRTASGVWCGINLNNLEPTVPGLVCWHPDTGLTLNLSHGYRAFTARQAAAKGYRPAGFGLLGAGRSHSWRCRKIDLDYAENCSSTTGTPVFTCTNGSRLTCKNSLGRGFRVDRLGGFVTF